MSRLLLAGAAVVALAIAFFVWPDDDAEQGAPPAAPAARDDQPAAEPARSSAKAPERVVPRPPPRRGPVPAPPAALEPPADEAAPLPAFSEGRDRPAELPQEEVDPKTAEIRAAQQLFDNKDYEAAAAAGVALVEKYPKEYDLYRVAVPALCAIGEAELANKYARKVRNRDKRRSIVKHCRRLGLEIP